MASTAFSGPDSVVTVKVQWDGCTRRAKMVLRDMVPGILETQIRTFLQIPADTDITIERYSDSATRYVRLSNDDVSVYKQLYRAAKAKSKLKLRVTANAELLTQPETQQNRSSAPSPRSVTVEEVSEVASPKPKPAETKLPVVQAPPKQSDNAAAATQHKPATNAFVESFKLTEAQSFASMTLPERPLGHQFRLAQASAQPPNMGFCGAAVSRGPCTRNAAFAVCCNSCDKTMPDVHYHCSRCDDGDFDLCQSCVDKGITCHSPSHWMIKRTTVNGAIVNSTTETIRPKVKKEVSETATKNDTPVSVERPSYLPAPASSAYHGYKHMFANMRTCNSCITELPEKEFLHCAACEDFDLCQSCFATNKHGHHPMHKFTVAVEGTTVSDAIKVKMAPGRNQLHHAICDGCDKFIMGVRHKCLDCPDWDFCAVCAPNAHIVHPGHRFVPIYEPLADSPALLSQPTHVGICCDGPLCTNSNSSPSYIRGVRYKCAVCSDTDFCAGCEASPNNTHSKTHPLIMIKSPLRHLSIVTTGEEPSGAPMPTMGDRVVKQERDQSMESKTSAQRSYDDWSPRVNQWAQPAHRSESPVKPTVAEDVSQSIAKKEEELSEKQALITKSKVPDEVQVPAPAVVTPPKPEEDEQDLRGIFVRDTVMDGTIMPPNYVFEQSWVLRNNGSTAWPAGCSVKFVGGDYMGHVDSSHPAEVAQLVSASESTISDDSLKPGQDFAFTVLLRAPPRAGKFVSYWRLTTPNGVKFGDRLWCDINVRAFKVEEPAAVMPVDESPAPQTPAASANAEERSSVEAVSEQDQASSTMIFPKLEKESPAASMHETTTAPSVQTDDKLSTIGPQDESADDEDWDVSENGFLTDEEYDILDASDEEYLDEQAKKFAQ